MSDARAKLDAIWASTPKEKMATIQGAEDAMWEGGMTPEEWASLGHASLACARGAYRRWRDRKLWASLALPELAQKKVLG